MSGACLGLLVLLGPAWGLPGAPRGLLVLLGLLGVLRLLGLLGLPRLLVLLGLLELWSSCVSWDSRRKITCLGPNVLC